MHIYWYPHLLEMWLSHIVKIVDHDAIGQIKPSSILSLNLAPNDLDIGSFESSSRTT